MFANRLQLMFDNLPSSIEHIRAGRLRAIAVTTANAVPSLPGVPPVAATIPGYEAVSWHGLMRPRGTPPEVAARLNAATNAALRLPAVRAQIENQGAIPLGSSPGEFGAYLAAEIARWAPVVRAAGVTPGG
jgi:tripartite-type tricarboxylate transporter receptor subunit TctC